MIEILDRGQGPVIGIRASGKISGADFDPILERLERAVAEHGKIRLLIQIEKLGTFSPGAFLEDARFSIEHAKDIERVAVVADGVLFGTYVKAASKLVPGEVRRFKSKELGEAWRWIDA